MSSLRDKAPVAGAIGAFSFVRQRCGGAGHRTPCRRQVGLYAGAIRFSVSSIPRAIDARTIWRNCAGSIVSAPHSISSFPSSVAASSRRRASSFSSWARCSRSFLSASRAVGLDLAIVFPSCWPLVPSAPDLGTAGACRKMVCGAGVALLRRRWRGLSRRKTKSDAGFGAASRTTGPHHFYRASPAKIVAPIAASRPLSRSLTQPVTHILRSS